MKKNLIAIMMAALVANVSYAQNSEEEFFDLQTPFAKMHAQFEKMEQEMQQVQQNFDKTFKALEQQINAHKAQKTPSNNDGYYSHQSFSSSSFSSQPSDDSLSITESMSFNQYSSKVVQGDKNKSKKIEKVFAGNLLSTNYAWLNQMLLSMEYQTLGGQEAKPTIQTLNQLWQQKYQQVNQANDTAIVNVKQQLMFADKNMASFYQGAYIQLGAEKQEGKHYIETLNVDLNTHQPISLQGLVLSDKWAAFNGIVEKQLQQKLSSLETKGLSNKEKETLKAKIEKIKLPLLNNYYLSKEGLHIVYYNELKSSLNLKDSVNENYELLLSWKNIKNWLKPKYVPSQN